MASDMFLKINGIDGESNDNKYKDQIEVLSFSWGAHQQSSMSSGGGGGAGKASVNELSITHMVDRASPNLLLYLMGGKHIDQAILTVRKAGGTPLDYFKITMKHLIISSVQHGGSNGGDGLTEVVNLSFSEFKMEYQPQGKDGKAVGGVITAAWDIKANKAA